MAGNTAERVRKIVEPYAKELGLSIWDICYVKEGALWFLRIFIDKPGGVTIEDCENFSRAVDLPLDDADPIKESYCLEVCSPGLGRELTRPEHFAAYIGAEVTVKLIRPLGGEREFVGKLVSAGESVVLNIGGEEKSFDKQGISAVKLNDDCDLF
jgi:ribosome maturation factor RimP